MIPEARASVVTTMVTRASIVTATVTRAAIVTAMAAWEPHTPPNAQLLTNSDQRVEVRDYSVPKGKKDSL